MGKILDKSQIYWRRRIFLLTWLGYAGFYFCRKNLSVTWSSLEKEAGFTADDYAMILFVYSLLYTFGQFFNGFLSDKFNARRVASAGLFLAAFCNLILGFSYSIGIVIFLIGLNGYGQSTGWSGFIKNMNPWFVRTERGVVMSWWSTCYVVGASLATAFATYVAFDMEFMKHLEWRRGFIFPSLVLFIIACLYATFTRNSPEEVGITPIATQQKDKSVKLFIRRNIALSQLLRKSELWIYSMCYFILKLTRYSFLFWLPMYLEKALNYDKNEAGYSSSSYELAGFLGVIIAGYASDKLFKSRRFDVITIMFLLLAVACLTHPYFVSLGKFATIVSIALIGLGTYGADSIISTAGAMDVGGKETTAMAAGIINGVGSIGQMISGFIVVYIQELYGWNSLFYLFVILSFFGGVLSAIKWNKL